MRICGGSAREHDGSNGTCRKIHCFRASFLGRQFRVGSQGGVNQSKPYLDALREGSLYEIGLPDGI